MGGETKAKQANSTQFHTKLANIKTHLHRQAEVKAQRSNRRKPKLLLHYSISFNIEDKLYFTGFIKTTTMLRVSYKFLFS
jgi:hypothetical protein